MSDETDEMQERGSRAGRRALARQRGAVHREPDAPPHAAVELEGRVARAWEEVLQRVDLGVHDNFFEVGGDSILLAQLQRRLYEAVGPVAVIELLQNPTIASLARHLATAAGSPSRLPGAAAPSWQQSGTLARQRSFMEQRRKMRREENDL